VTSHNTATPDELTAALTAIDELRTAVATHLDQGRASLDYACENWTGGAGGPALAKLVDKWSATDDRLREDLERVYNALDNLNRS